MKYSNTHDALEVCINKDTTCNIVSWVLIKPRTTERRCLIVTEQRKRRRKELHMIISTMVPAESPP